jgi:hypothetical protein
MILDIMGRAATDMEIEVEMRLRTEMVDILVRKAMVDLHGHPSTRIRAPAENFNHVGLAH